MVHQDDLVAAVFEASPDIIEISESFPYDEFVLVLKGEVTLTNIEVEYEHDRHVAFRRSNFFAAALLQYQKANKLSGFVPEFR